MGNFFKDLRPDDDGTEENLKNLKDKYEIEKNKFKKLQKERNLKVENKKNQKIIISNNYRKIDTKKSEERYEPEIAFSGSMVNSNDKILNDLLLTNIRA